MFHEIDDLTIEGNGFHPDVSWENDDTPRTLQRGENKQPTSTLNVPQDLRFNTGK